MNIKNKYVNKYIQFKRCNSLLCKKKVHVYCIAILYYYSCFFSMQFFYSCQISSDGNTSTSILTFVASIEDGGQYLTCRAENQQLPTSMMEDAWKLDVQCNIFFKI